MSDYIPFEMRKEIIKRLPVKSSIQFRGVSKLWNSFIGSSEFICGYGVYQQRLLVSYKTSLDREEFRVSISDDHHTFSQHIFPLDPTVPAFIKLLRDLEVIDSSHGLLCLHGYFKDLNNFRYRVPTEMAVLWNPLIRKSVGIVMPPSYSYHDSVVGFGVSPVTKNPIILKIKHANMSRELTKEFSCPWVVEVFTLRSGSWRQIVSTNLPRPTINVQNTQVVVDRFIYWSACERVAEVNTIVSFDMTTQEFQVIDLPDCLSHRFSMRLSKLHDSVVVLEYKDTSVTEVCAVWKMLHGSFTRLFTIKAPNPSIKMVLGFTNTGEPILLRHDEHDQTVTIEAYEPCSEHIKTLGIYEEDCTLFVSSYMETPLLLDQTDCHIYHHTN